MFAGVRRARDAIGRLQFPTPCALRKNFESTSHRYTRRTVTPYSRTSCCASNLDGRLLLITRRSHATGGTGIPPTSSPYRNDNDKDNESNQTKGSWSKFASNWNDTLQRRPQETLATYLAAQSTSWLLLYTALTATGAASSLFPPELAAGWMVARLTKKLRQPLNAALAATGAALCPSLGDVKVAPLVTGLVAPNNGQARKEMQETRQRMERNVPGLKGTLDGVSRGFTYMEGPVNKYGLAFFLSGKISSLSTVAASTVLISRGLDLEAMLVEWGIGEGLGGVAGTLAGAAVLNAFATPLHFVAAVYGVHSLEKIAQMSAPIVTELEQATSDKDGDSSSNDKITTGIGRSDQGLSKRDNRQNEEDGEESIIRSLGLVLLLWSFAISMYAIRKLGEKAVEGETENDEELHK